MGVVEARAAGVVEGGFDMGGKGEAWGGGWSWDEGWLGGCGARRRS